MRWGRERLGKIVIGKFEGKRYSENVVVNGRIIFKKDCREIVFVCGVWIWFIWLKIRALMRMELDFRISGMSFSGTILHGFSYFSSVNVRILNRLFYWVQLVYQTRRTLSTLFTVLQKSCDVSNYFHLPWPCAL